MSLEWVEGVPTPLSDPIIVAAFEGWNDAADSATRAVEHVELTWGAQPLAEIAGDDYYDYTEQRPEIHYADGVTRELQWPTIHVSYCRIPGTDRDLVLLRGPEPQLRWRSFCAEFVALADTVDASEVILLGAFLSDVPHTREVPLIGAAYSRRRMDSMNVERSRYNGPTGVVGVVQHECTAAGIPAITVWSSVPHYVAAPPNPQATMRLLTWLENEIGAGIQLGSLRAQAEQWIAKIDAAAAEDEDLADYISSLEDQADEDGVIFDETPSDDLKLVDGEALAAEFEKYLRGDNGSENI